MINGLEITDVIIFPVKKKDGTLKAFVKVIINDQLIISGIRIVEGRNGPFICFPQETNERDGKCFHVCFPITAELRSYMSDQILSQYAIPTKV